MSAFTEDMPPLRLTLVVAATQQLGIGLNGSLPWRLRQEMAYFARVTTRLHPPSSVPLTGGDADGDDGDGNGSAGARAMQNAVIMGRKTWESIPKRFRPLKDRINVVLSQSAEVGQRDGALWMPSLQEAVRKLESMQEGMGSPDKGTPMIARAFVIGGAGVYKAALELPNIADRVLLTRVYGDFECDTFFPLDLDHENGQRLGWQRRSSQELSSWVGEEIPAQKIKECDVVFEYCMYERV